MMGDVKQSNITSLDPSVNERAKRLFEDDVIPMQFPWRKMATHRKLPGSLTCEFDHVRGQQSL